MVKFADGDHRIRIIASKLAEICGIRQMSAPVSLTGFSTAFECLHISQDKQLAIPDSLFLDNEC
jgi:hypothetical protein